MKRSEQVAHINKLSLRDLKAAVLELEQKLQAQTLAITFGKAKDVKTVKNLKRQLARTLTLASQKLAVPVTENKEL